MRISIFIAAILLSGCQTISQVDNSPSCSDNREPASLRCESLFESEVKSQPEIQQIQTLRMPSKQELSTFFAELENYGAKPWDIIKAAELGYVTNVGKPEKPIHLGALLIERRSRGESTAKILTELGYKAQSGYLMPPRNISTLYANIYSKLRKSAEEAGIKEEDIIWPCLLFERYSEVDRKQELKFVRPGMDALPPKNQNWQIVMRESELNQENFSRMILERKMLFSPGMFSHDINHIIDFIERPHYMPAFKNFLAAKRETQSIIMDLKEAEKIYGKNNNALKSDEVLNELMTYPSEARRALIDKTLLSPSSSSESSAETIARYEKLGLERSLKKAREILSKQDILFARHGGGMRDFFVDRYEDNFQTLKGLEDLIGNKSSYDPLGRDFQRAYLDNEAPGMFQRLALIVNFAENPQALSPVIHKRLSWIAPERGVDVQTLTPYLLARQLSEIDQRIRAGLRYQITPEKILSDLSLLAKPQGWKLYLRTSTYAYFSTYRKGTYQRHVFVDITPLSE